jgi:hypothetical protein
MVVAHAKNIGIDSCVKRLYAVGWVGCLWYRELRVLFTEHPTLLFCQHGSYHGSFITLHLHLVCGDSGYPPNVLHPTEA